MLAVCQAYQLFLPDIPGHHVLVRSDSRSVMSNKSPGHPRLGATPHAVEWTFQPARGSENMESLWQGSSRPASKDNSHCPIFFTRSMDALAHEWPSLPLYAFPPVALLPQVLWRVRELWHKLLLIAPLWWHGPSDSVGVRVIAVPRPIPLRWDLLSQVNGTIWHPRSDLWALHVSRREPFGLPERVLNTKARARAPSTRHLYALKWSIFSAWCQDRDLDPVTSDMSVVLSFLQEMLDKQHP